MVKPAQTGIAGGAPSDVAEVVRLAAPAHAATLAEYPEPLPPLMAARFAGKAPLRLRDAIEVVRDLIDRYDLVLVEGSGGLLTPIGGSYFAGWTLTSLRSAPRASDAAVIVVTRTGPGSLNHAALTCAALARDDMSPSVVIGAWPKRAERVHRSTLAELRLGLHEFCDFYEELVGVIPEGAGRMEPRAFRRAAPSWLAPDLYGDADKWETWNDFAERPAPVGPGVWSNPASRTSR